MNLSRHTTDQVNPLNKSSKKTENSMIYLMWYFSSHLAALSAEKKEKKKTNFLFSTREWQANWNHNK